MEGTIVLQQNDVLQMMIYALLAAFTLVLLMLAVTFAVMMKLASGSNRKPDTGDLPYQASADIFSDTSLYQARVDGGMDAKLDDEARMEYENALKKLDVQIGRATAEMLSRKRRPAGGPFQASAPGVSDE